MSSRCGKCGREIHEDRSSCLYCGWSKAEGGAAPTAERPVAAGPATFRSGATTWRFLGWASAATAAGWIVLRQASRGAGSPEDDRLLAAAVALFVLGPLAFLAQVLRVALVRVTVDPGAGLRLPRGRFVPWDEIEGVDFAGLRMADDRTLIRFLLDVIRGLSSGITEAGLWAALHILLIGAVACLVLAVAFVSGVCLPVFLLLSPWQPRVVVRLKNGRSLVWRDLTREADFVHRVKAGLKG